MEQIGIITYYNMILLATIIRRYLPVNIRHTKKSNGDGGSSRSFVNVYWGVATKNIYGNMGYDVAI